MRSERLLLLVVIFAQVLHNTCSTPATPASLNQDVTWPDGCYKVVEHSCKDLMESESECNSDKFSDCTITKKEFCKEFSLVFGFNGPCTPKGFIAYVNNELKACKSGRALRRYCNFQHLKWLLNQWCNYIKAVCKLK